MIEAAYQHRGFAFNSEFHWKGIDDRATGHYSNIGGFYLQAGYFPHGVWDFVPEPLELAARIARVLSERPTNDAGEIALGANWFFIGHRSKVTTDVTWFDYDAELDSENAWMWRIQWDVSL